MCSNFVELNYADFDVWVSGIPIRVAFNGLAIAALAAIGAD
jgi:hypothetical protein